MSEMLRIRKSTLDAFGDAIREKSGGTDLISPLNLPAEIRGLTSGIDTSSITVYSGSSCFYPSSPIDNDIFYNNSTEKYYIYNNGSWAELNYQTLSLSLLTNGTWGKTYIPSGAHSGGTYSNGAITLNASSHTYIHLWTNNKIDLSKYSKIKVVYTISNSSGARAFVLTADSDANIGIVPDVAGTSHGDYSQVWYNPANGTYTQIVDISSWTSSKYLGFYSMAGGDSNLNVKITTVELM